MAQNDEAMRYQKEQDAYTTAQNEALLDYNKKQTERTDSYNRSLDLIDDGIMPESDLLNTAGITTREAQSLIAKKYGKPLTSKELLSIQNKVKGAIAIGDYVKAGEILQQYSPRLTKLIISGFAPSKELKKAYDAYFATLS